MRRIWYYLFLLTAVGLVYLFSAGYGGGGNMYRQGERGYGEDLTPHEYGIIVNKGTERPFTGRYWDFTGDGRYICRRCGATLFESGTKFSTNCGWPSFDEAVQGAVKQTLDADGRRIEITCANCGGHLGHVFHGEGFTPKDTRYCVNSASLDFVTRTYGDGSPVDTAAQTARGIFAGGCFWGVEYHLRRLPGVISVISGYTGGHKDNPTYEEVCSGRTGHAEAVEVVYNPAQISYAEIARRFFEIHDPTQRNRQGPDIGTQYRSAIFYLSDEQHTTARALVAELEAKGYRVVTELVPAGKFWPAEGYHQEYYTRKGGTPYCHIPVKRF